MTSSAHREPRTARLQFLFLVLGLLLLAALVYGVGLRAMLLAFQRLGWLTPLIVIPYFTSYAMDSLGWWWVLSRCFLSEADKSTPPLLKLFAIRAAGEAVNASTPTAYLGGEPVKVWLARQYGVPLVPGLASVLVSKTALMLTQGGYVMLGLLIALHEWYPAIPLPLAGTLGLLLGILTYGLLVGAQRRGLFSFLLGLTRRWSGREAILASWEPHLLALDDRLQEFYGANLRAFLICCGYHFLGWIVGSFEVYVILGMLGSPVDLLDAVSIDALSGVAKLAAVFVPGSLGVQEGGQVLIFVAFGLGAPVAMTFGLLRRARELLWVGFGLGVLIRHQAFGWLRKQREAEGEP